VSAVYDAIFSARDVNLSEAVIFTSYFPSTNDLILIISTGITSIYYQGEMDLSSRDFIDSLPEASIPLEIIQLK
jgi:deoxycytidylate deaminase